MIAFNYNEAIAQAEALDQISQELTDLVNRTLKSKQAELQYAWEGDAAGLFYQKMEELCEDLSKSARRTEKIAGNISSAAKTIKAVEDAAKKLLQA